MSEPVFHIIAEDPEEEHIPDNMHPSAMEEHRCEKRKNRPHPDIVMPDISDDRCGDDAERGDEVVRPVPTERKLKQKNRGIDSDENVIHHRDGIGWIGVAQGNQVISDLEFVNCYDVPDSSFVAGERI